MAQAQAEFVAGVVTGVPYALTSTYDNGRYHLGTSLCQNPVDPKTVVVITTDGADHVPTGDKQLICFRSADFGITFGAPAIFHAPSPAPWAAQGQAAGYDSRGRLHVISSDYGIVYGPTRERKNRYLYSDDDGATWSTPVDLTLPTPWGLMIGDIIENNGVLIACHYGGTLLPDDTLDQYFRNIYRSTDYGASWAPIAVVGGSAQYINESSVIALDDSTLLMLSRIEYSPWEYMQSVSTDNGLTWADQGLTDFYSPNNTQVSGPPVLRRFDLSGVRVIVCYYSNDWTTNFDAIYATAANLKANGLAGWNAATQTVVADGENGLYYAGVCHYNNNFNARAACSRELAAGPWNNQHNTTVWLELPSTHYTAVKSALGVV